MMARKSFVLGLGALGLMCAVIACGSDDNDGGSSTGGAGGASGGSAGSSSGGSAGSSSGGAAGASQCQPPCGQGDYCSPCMGPNGVTYACIPNGSAC